MTTRKLIYAHVISEVDRVGEYIFNYQDLAYKLGANSNAVRYTINDITKKLPYKVERYRPKDIKYVYVIKRQFEVA